MIRNPHELGYRVAAMEISQGIASFTRAKERGLFPDNGADRIAWNAGYEDCVCAHRLGFNVQRQVQLGVFVASQLSPGALVGALLDGTWELPTRADPRRLSDTCPLPLSA